VSFFLLLVRLIAAVLSEHLLSFAPKLGGGALIPIPKK
jgi:hypothetical protein